MTNPIDTQILDLNRPGVVVEVDARTAEALGAFEEDALDEARPWRPPTPTGRGSTDGRARGEGPVLRAGRQQAHRAASGRDRPLAEALGAGEHPPAPQPGLGDPVQGLELHVAGDAGQGRPALDDLQAGQQRGRPGPPGREGDPGPILEAHRPDPGEGRARQAGPGRRGQQGLPQRPVGEAQGLLRRGLQRRADRRPAAACRSRPPTGTATSGPRPSCRRPASRSATTSRTAPSTGPPRTGFTCRSRDSFQSADTYYATALHELGHWTGHPPAWTGTWPTPSAASATPRRSCAPRSPP